MNKYLTLIFVLCSTMAFAQNAKFSFFAGVNYGILNAKDTYSERFSFIATPTQDFTVTKQNLTWVHSSDIEPGFNAGLNIHFPLKKNINIRAGIEVQYVTFILNSNVTNIADDLEFGTIQTDDISDFFLANMTIGDVRTESFCDDFGFNITSEIANRVSQHLYYGKIPLGLEANIFEGDITIYAGVFFSSVIKREIGTDCFSVDLTSGNFIPTFDFTKINHSTDINTSVFGGDFGFSYHLVDKISLEGSFSTSFNSIFTSKNENFSATTGAGIPATLQVASLGARLYLN